MLRIWLWIANKLTTGKYDGYNRTLIHTKRHLVKVTAKNGSRYLTIHRSNNLKFWNYVRFDMDTGWRVSGKYPYAWVK